MVSMHHEKVTWCLVDVDSAAETNVVVSDYINFAGT